MKLYPALVFLLIFTTCGSPVVDQSVDFQSPTPIVTDKIVIEEWQRTNVALSREINEAKQRWNNAGIRSYDFILRRDIGGMYSPWNRSPMLMRVRDGQPVTVEIVDKDDVSLAATTEGLPDFDTIDDLFAYMLRQLALGEIVKEDYDDTLGFPRLITLENASHNHGIRGITIIKFSDLSK